MTKNYNGYFISASGLLVNEQQLSQNIITGRYKNGTKFIRILTTEQVEVRLPQPIIELVTVTSTETEE